MKVMPYNLNNCSALEWAHPLVHSWFTAKYATPTEPQREGWPSILAGQSTLISAPTGSGKTFAAFLICLEQLVCKAINGELDDKTSVIYISPLKALSNDVQKNLMQPLQEIRELAYAKGLSMQDIRVSVRTGDTLTKERLGMLKTPPHILVTTPESFYILLTAEKSRRLLAHVKTVIIDEIHALVNDKRGSHLALSLERLEALCARPLTRIGLSATQKPIDQVAKFLIGARETPVKIVNIGHVKKMELRVEVPDSELSSVASNEMWAEIYDKLAELAKRNRSTLIFVNTRRLAERVAHHLAERLGEEQVAAHHGSLSPKIRHVSENKLKSGQLKALVATASLELGIDIGFIDLVCQIGSPRAIAIALQRVGRAGHWRGAMSKGIFFATTRDELVECAALIHAIRVGELDQIIMPEEPLDILAQQIIATCATGDWQEKELYHLVTRAHPYKNLSLISFEAILTMLSEGIAGSRGRYGAYLFRDKVNSIVKARKGSRITAITSGGAIPENGLFTVVCEPDGAKVGTLDEDFAVESNQGDIILLGTTSWRVRRVENGSGRVLVENAQGMPPSVPFWRGEAPARSIELSKAVSDLRKKVSDLLPLSRPAIIEVTKHSGAEQALTWLMTHCGLDKMASEQLANYILQGRAVLGEVPTQQTIIAERFFDEGGGMQLVIHAPFGARINKAWGLALRKKFCRSFNFELQAAATDDGLTISLAEQHSFPLSDVFHFLYPNTLYRVLEQAVLQSPIFNTRWRWTATRSLALVRYWHGKKRPPNIQRMLSDDLLAAVFPDAAACQDNLGGKEIDLPDHPLILETMKEVLNQALDYEGFLSLIKKIINKEINCIAIDTPVPSVFSHELLNANPYAFLDDAPLEERRTRAVEMRRYLPNSVLEEVGKLEPKAIFEVKKQAWPDIRSADDLHDFLQTVVACPLTISQLAPEGMTVNWQMYIDNLIAEKRVGFGVDNKITFLLATEQASVFHLIYPNSQLLQPLPIIANKIITKEDALTAMVRGWLLHLGPCTAELLANFLSVPLSDLELTLLRLEGNGFILRGKFSQQKIEEWCERRLLARIHRITVAALRQEITPVTSAQFIHWLAKWQHLAAGTQLSGEAGLLEVIRQLQGYELPINAWEREIFAKRVTHYTSQMLDRLCLMGVVGWGRFSIPTQQSENKQEESQKRRQPTKVAPITFFIRAESEWIPATLDTRESSLLRTSYAAAEVYQYLKQRGASFFSDILREVKRLPIEIEDALWELVAIGAVTADGYDNLRGLINGKKHADRRRKTMQFGSGRWSLLHFSPAENETLRIEAACWMLLKRYGVVFRDLLAREKNIPRWRELLMTFRHLEAKGQIRGGRFVDGFLGEQYALPYAVESLRAHRKEQAGCFKITLSSSDPLNLFGIILPGKKISSLASKKIQIDV